MSRALLLLAPLALIACSGGKGDDTSGNADGGGDGGGGGCDVTIAPLAPTADQTDFYYRSAIEVGLSAADASATITVAGVDGTSSFSEDGLTAIFTPSASLSPSTDYVATVSFCDGANTADIAFRTSALGTPTDGCDLTGKTFEVDLAAARFVQPAGVAELLLGQLEDQIYVGVQANNGSSLDMIGALGQGGMQDTCNPSIPFPPATYADPYFSVGPQNTTLSVAGFDIEISNLQISGDFASDCSAFGGGVLAGELDARVLAPLVGDLLGSSDPDQVCALLIGFGVACEPCASDGQNYCVSVLVDQIDAGTINTTLQCVDEADCHPGCATSTCDDTSLGECE